MNEPVVYRHVQEGKFVRAMLVGLACLLLAIEIWLAFGAARSADQRAAVAILLVIVPLLIVVDALFSTLKIEVTEREVRWAFGVLSWPRGHIARTDLLPPTVEDPGFWNGIGIHLTWRGWLWNVAVGKAVALHKRDGGSVMLGTDDPDGLMRALASP